MTFLATSLRHHDHGNDILFWGRGCSRDLFFSCSQCVRIIFTWGSHQVPNLFPKAPRLYPTWLAQTSTPMYTNWKGGPYGSTFVSILWLRVQRDVSIGECPMLVKNWWCLGAKKASSQQFSVSNCLLQFLEPLIRMVHHWIDKQL
jgi:hypothetical protein